MNKRKRPPTVKTTQRSARKDHKIRRGNAASATISHDECEARLDFYVDSERRGEKARFLFPAIWAHLQTCDRCRASHDWLAETLHEDSSLDSRFETDPNIVPALPFVQPAQEDAAWSIQVRSSIGGGPLGFGFAIRAPHLQKLFFSNAPMPPLRGDDASAGKSLILSDTLSLGRRQVAVELWAVHTPDPTQVQLKVAVASSITFPEPLRAILRWNDHRSTDWVRNGACVFDDIPIAELEGADDLRVEFEVESSNAVQ